MKLTLCQNNKKLTEIIIHLYFTSEQAEYLLKSIVLKLSVFECKGKNTLDLLLLFTINSIKHYSTWMHDWECNAKSVMFSLLCYYVSRA